MANDCLQTKLKSVVANDNLNKLGEISIGIHTYSGTPFRNTLVLKCSSAITLSTSDGNAHISLASDMSNPMSSYTLEPKGSNTIIYFGYDANYKVEIANKYGISHFETSAYDILDFTSKIFKDYLIGLKEVDLTKMPITISDLNGVDLTYLRLDGCSINDAQVSLAGISKDLTYLLIKDVNTTTRKEFKTSEIGAFTKVEYLNFYNTSVSGDIANLSTCTKATNMDFWGSYGLTGSITSLGGLKGLRNLRCTNNSQLSGEINDLVALLRTDNPSGIGQQVIFALGSTQCTYNGDPAPSTVTITL